MQLINWEIRTKSSFPSIISFNNVELLKIVECDFRGDSPVYTVYNMVEFTVLSENSFSYQYRIDEEFEAIKKSKPDYRFYTEQVLKYAEGNPLSF